MSETGISKIEAAGRLLDSAIKSRLGEKDSLATHTLAFAAFGILRDLVKHREHPMKDVLAILEEHSEFTQFAQQRPALAEQDETVWRQRLGTMCTTTST